MRSIIPVMNGMLTLKITLVWVILVHHLKLRHIRVIWSADKKLEPVRVLKTLIDVRDISGTREI